uniref:Uncharacterized protein n=1 Tax=Glossina pallidipes TaxID=7398 RepID=A0A1A9ZSP1_GLOPL
MLMEDSMLSLNCSDCLKVLREAFLAQELLQAGDRKFNIRFQEFCDSVDENIENVGIKLEEKINSNNYLKKICPKAKFKPQEKNGRGNQINTLAEDICGINMDGSAKSKNY